MLQTDPSQLARVVEEKPAIKNEDFEARLVELGNDKFGRNVVVPNKTNSDMGAKINLEHEGQIEADELQKIELLDENNLLARAGGSRATSKYTSHALIHYLSKLDKNVCCAFVKVHGRYFAKFQTSSPGLGPELLRQRHSNSKQPQAAVVAAAAPSCGIRAKRMPGSLGSEPNYLQPFLCTGYDNLTPKGKLKDYKEGGQAVKFDTFHGTHDKLKALLFLQQFDAAFAGGNFTEASKIRKAATFLKINALQWWTTMLNQGVVPSTWVRFKQIFAPAWITNTFEVDVMTAWNQLSAINCESLEEYNAKFWDALLPVISFKIVPLAEQIEKYCCGLPKGIKKFCTKTSVMNMAQLMENAEVADDLIHGKPDEDGFKTRRKEPQGKQFSAKGNVTLRLTVPPFKKKPFVGSKPFAGNRPNAENQRFRPPSFSGQRQGFKRHFTGKTIEECKALRDARKCYICEEEGHFANECPERNSQNKDDKSDRKGKKPKPSAGLVPDLVGDQQNVDATELCRAWGKVRDQEVLVFFDPGARANFISLKLASKLGIRAEKMGMTREAGPHAKVLVLRASSIGLVTLMDAKAFGPPHVIVVDVDENRPKLAKELGAHAKVCVSTKAQDVRERTAAKEVNILDVFRYKNTYWLSINLIRIDRIDVKPLVTHRYGFLHDNVEVQENAQIRLFVSIILFCNLNKL
ncbi:hypothetical protein L7F22_031679 [Adiantum nelumboides]|nr:hypothetical protein [Adiantum nelumboides]